jgi:hypothetical protein
MSLDQYQPSDSQCGVGAFSSPGIIRLSRRENSVGNSLKVALAGSSSLKERIAASIEMPACPGEHPWLPLIPHTQIEDSRLPKKSRPRARVEEHAIGSTPLLRFTGVVTCHVVTMEARR